MTETALRRLISLGESQTLEFKQALPEDLGRELCAFANSAGGMILIGVSNTGVITPLSSMNRCLSQVQDHARNCEPPVSVDVEVVSDVIVIKVRSSREKPHSSRGIFYLREGANSQKMSRSQIKEFFFKEGLLYFDSAMNNQYKIERDLSQSEYAAFAKYAGIDPNLDMLDTLRNISLVTDDGMTNAGCLVLSRTIAKFLVSATVTCALFQGTTKTKILDQKVFSEDIASNYRNALQYLQAHLNTEYIIGATREEKLELPETALREALINALAHRDYRSSANVQIYIFSDRLEIVNPGGLVGGMLLKDLGKRSVPRNPLLFGTLYRMNLVEHVGSGIKRIREALVAEGLSPPLLEADEQWFSISFKRFDRSAPPTGSQETSQKKSPTASPTASQKRDKFILDLIAAKPEILLEELSTKVGISERSIKRHLSTLKTAGRLKRIGGTFGGHWEVLN